jgi:iron(III) transport system permease protein
VSVPLLRPRVRTFSLPVPGDLGPWALTVGLAALILLPIAMLVMGSLSSARLPSDFSLADVTLANYVSVYTDPLTYRVMGNTAIYVAGTLVFGLSLAFAFAWLVARTDMPGKWLALIGVPAALSIPGLLEAMAWVLLFSPRIGYANRLAMDVLGLQQPPFNAYTMGSMVALESLRLVPTSFLMFLPLLLRLDPAVEEAAAMSGARLTTIIRRITLPLLLPGLLAVGLYQAVTVLSSFEVPGIIGLPGQIYVFSTLVYTYASGTISSGGSDYGRANALAMVYLLINVVGLWIYARAVRQTASFAVVTGRGYRPRVIELGWVGWLGTAAIAAYVLLAVVLPTAVMVWSSLTPIILPPSAAALSRLTLDNWSTMLTSSQFLRAVGNTMVVVVVTATATVVVSVMVAWVTTRTRFKAKGLLDQLSFVSHGVPGVILGLALVWFWIRVDLLPIYGTLWIIVLGLSIGFLAYGARTMAATLLQIHAELEEAAYSSGADFRQTLRRIFVPLLVPGLTGLWIWVAMHAIRYTTLPLMLEVGPANMVISVYLWRQWDIGAVGVVMATGTLMMLLMLVTVLVAGRLGLSQRYLGLTS